MLPIHPVATVYGQLPYKSQQMTAHPEKHCSGCWMVRPDTVVTGWMGNICYHVTPVATGGWWPDGNPYLKRAVQTHSQLQNLCFKCATKLT